MLLDRTIARLLPVVPKPVVQLFSSRYIAGPTLADAVLCVERLNAEGKRATIDVLGEEITNEAQTREITSTYCDVLGAIDRLALDATISVKLTALGLDLSYELARENLGTVLDTGHFVRMDMEDSSTTDENLRLYRELRESGRDNVGIVLQAYLRRTLDDVYELAELKPNVRLCKGIYVEPPTLAFKDPDDIRTNFVRALDTLLDAGCHVAVATHDEQLIQYALKRNAPAFQMLLGVREQRASELVAEGHPVRIYVPFGDQWYAYSMRRLQENPAMAGTILRSIVTRER